MGGKRSRIRSCRLSGRLRMLVLCFVISGMYTHRYFLLLEVQTCRLLCILLPWGRFSVGWGTWMRLVGTFVESSLLWGSRSRLARPDTVSISLSYCTHRCAYLLDKPVDAIHDIFFLVQRIYFRPQPMVRKVEVVVQHFAHGTVGCATTSPTYHRLSGLELLNTVGHVAFADHELWVGCDADLHMLCVGVCCATECVSAS